MPGIRFDFRDTDKGWNALVQELKAMHGGGTYVKVGVFGGTRDRRPGEKIGNVELATIHEYGAKGGIIPKRSFLRDTFDIKREQWNVLFKTLLIAKFAKKPDRDFSAIIKILKLVGLKMVDDVKKRITTGAGIPPKLKQATIDRKGSDRPLVDTGRLLNSITYVVVKQGQEVKTSG